MLNKTAGTSMPVVHSGKHVILGVAYLVALGVLAARTVQKQQPHYANLKQGPVMRFLQRLQARLSSD